MKLVVISIIAFVVLILNSCVYDFTPLETSEIDSVKIKLAIGFADDYLNTIKSGEVYELTDLLVPQMKEGLGEENQQKNYQGIKQKYGDYKELEYAETWVKGSHPDMRIIRLKGTFTESTKKLEVRVVLNKENEIAGFWIKPWAKKML